jgi:hypothetical protein
VFALKSDQKNSVKVKPPEMAASSDPAKWSAFYLSWVEMLVNLPLRVVPIELTAAIITTECQLR